MSLCDRHGWFATPSHKHNGHLGTVCVPPSSSLVASAAFIGRPPHCTCLDRKIPSSSHVHVCILLTTPTDVFAAMCLVLLQPVSEHMMHMAPASDSHIYTAPEQYGSDPHGSGPPGGFGGVWSPSLQARPALSGSAAGQQHISQHPDHGGVAARNRPGAAASAGGDSTGGFAWAPAPSPHHAAGSSAAGAHRCTAATALHDIYMRSLP